MANAYGNRGLVWSDAGDGANLKVQNGPTTFLVPMSRVDDYLQGGPDPTDAYAFNAAARLGVASIDSCQTAPNSGKASAAALASLNAASFKGY